MTQLYVEKHFYEEGEEVRSPIIMRYEGMSPREALWDFYTCCNDFTPRDWVNISCYEKGKGEPPSRHLMNWEITPDHEVSEGYLTNIAAMVTTEKELLMWSPSYCTNATWVTTCPICQAVMASRRGSYGPFVVCEVCGNSKFGWYTKKWYKNTYPDHFCGSPHQIFIGQLGNPYRGCYTCQPDGDYEKKPIRALLGKGVK